MNNTKFLFGLYSFHNLDSRLLIVTERVSVLEWLREMFHEFDLRMTPNLLTVNGWSPEINYNNCHEYKLHGLNLTHEHFINEDFMLASKLCKSWYSCYVSITNIINHQRKNLSAVIDLKLQEIIYQEKLNEAKNILEGKIENLKFLNLESNYRNVSLEIIASEVILQHDMYMGYLARTEFLRIKWLSKLKQSKIIEEHELIMNEFKRELNEYHRLS